MSLEPLTYRPDPGRNCCSPGGVGEGSQSLRWIKSALVSAKHIHGFPELLLWFP